MTVEAGHTYYFEVRGFKDNSVIRLLIADDHPIVREGLKRIIAECMDIQLIL